MKDIFHKPIESTATPNTLIEDAVTTVKRPQGNSKNHVAREPAANITREQLIEFLNEDLAGEYQAIIAYTVYSQMLKGAAYTDIARELELHAVEELQHAIKIAKQIDYLGDRPGVTPKPVKTCCDAVGMLCADLENEGKRSSVIANASGRLRQWANLR
jgi:bacterioferritin